jgi:hypothetical protein
MKRDQLRIAETPLNETNLARLRSTSASFALPRSRSTREHLDEELHAALWLEASLLDFARL